MKPVDPAHFESREDSFTGDHAVNAAAFDGRVVRITIMQAIMK